jgi:hypothetical protein
MDYLPCNLTYREEILLLFPLTIASPRYKQMAAWQRNGDVFVPIPRTRLAYGLPKWSRLNKVAVLFEYAVDADGNTRSEYWEWK